MNGLLPQVIRDAIESQSLYAASVSFGVVALVVLVVALLELEALRVMRTSPDRGCRTPLASAGGRQPVEHRGWGPAPRTGTQTVLLFADAP